MSEIFGIPLTTIMNVLLVVLAVCLLSVAWVAWRQPVIFKLGVRNLPRRKAQTVLIVVGLMLSTLIIAAALGTGDTIEHSATAATYEQLGEVDLLVVRSQDEEGNVDNAFMERFDAGVVERLDAAFADDSDVAGILPVLIEIVPAVFLDRGQGEPETFLVGIDVERVDQFGGLISVDGEAIDLAATELNEVVISEELADRLNAEVGDTITIFYENVPVPLTVAAVAVDSPLSGRFDPDTPGMVVPLDRLQQATSQEGEITLVAISNRGGVRGGLELTDTVSAKLRAVIADESEGLGVDPIKQRLVEQAEFFAQVFTGLFLILGLFSIAAGILLIVLIFTMLAAERRSEMGMARALGTHRRQLVQQFVAEGSAYALLAGFVGAALGVLAVVGIAAGMNVLFGDFLNVEPQVGARSLVVAYCLGVVITFFAVVGSSWRISRLNIVAAVRDIPDVSSPKRKRRTLVWAALLLIGGVLFTLQGQSSNQMFGFYLGMSLLPFGVALVLRFFGVPGRPVFTLVGIYLLTIWLLPEEPSRRLFGDLEGDFEMFFLSGIFTVAGATVAIVYNLDILLAGVSKLGGLFQSKLPAVRTAIAYPGAARSRTGLTIAMFSLIIFSMVMFATMNQNFVNLFLGDEANAGWDVRATGSTVNPIADFTGELEGRGIDTSEFEAVGVVGTMPQVSVRLADAADPEWKAYLLNGMDESFIDESELLFQQRAEGYPNDEAILEALRTEPNVAVIDSFAIPDDGPFGQEPSQFTLTGLRTSDRVFDPIQVEIQSPNGGASATLTIIGIIDSRIGSLFGIYGSQETTEAIFPAPAFRSYYVRLADPDAAAEVAEEIGQELLTSGLLATSIRDELEEFQQQNRGFLYIIQGFMGLGLVVGIAAVGVIAFRSVVERRQQIGMLRALGYQRSLVSLSFLLETGVVVGLGILSGTAIGLVLARIVFTSDEFGASGAQFVVPWGIVGAILLVTIVAALLMAWLPARQAARLAPAEALRYE